MNKQAKHSPLPWAILKAWPNRIVAQDDADKSIGWHNDDEEDQRRFATVLVESDDSVSPRAWRRIPRSVAVANAALIVRAVNHHDELVALLERVAEWNAPSGFSDCDRAIADARALLAKVKA